MQKKIILLLLPLVFACSQKMYGQVHFFDANVSKCGELKQVLGDKWDKIDSLVVHGPINGADFTTMWECSFEGELTVLNLEHAQIENNKIPTRALYKVEKQAVDDPRAYQGVVYLPLRRIILPEGIQEIGDFAFSRMKLEQINLPKSLRKLGRFSFSSCHWLSTDPLIIPEGVTSIPSQCFVNCQCFKKLMLPSTIKIIEGFAFYNTRVEEVNFPEGLELIKIAAFDGCDLMEAILPSTLKELSDFTFSMCPKLQEIKIPEGITKIPFAFASWCRSLEKVNIPKSVTVIEDDAFGSDVKLKSIDLPEGLRHIGKDAFWECAVDSIIFPASLEYLGAGSCANWENVKKIYSLSPNPPCCAADKEGKHKTFHGITPNDIPVYVPIGSGEKYRQAFGWNYFTNIIETDKFPTGIMSPKMGNNELCKVYGKDNELIIEIPNLLSSPIHYSIYSIEGTMIEQGCLTKSYTIKMPSKGVYIVRVGNATHKIFL